jgi:dinuclear metal center YbgI/SA1388 family protein
MIVRDIQKILEGWAPHQIAWERDNVGLQVGDPDALVSGILVALDVTTDVIAEAKLKNASLLVSHHPVLFRPAQSISTDTATGRCIRALLESHISLVSVHTNLDSVRGGTSFALAGVLGVRNVGFLTRSPCTQNKIVTFVPADHSGSVAAAMAQAGAGRIGNYEHCSFSIHGTGTFRGNSASNPAVGEKEKLEEVPEVRIEMIADRWQTPAIIESMKSAHPYEEVAYDVYPIDNFSSEYGMGIIGDLERPMRPSEFLRHVKKALRAEVLRHSPECKQTIRRVAACGGAGSDLTGEAVRQGADVFITSDVKYHNFHEAAGKIILVDAGHFETEFPVVDAVVERLTKELTTRGQRIPVSAASTPTNPIHYM